MMIHKAFVKECTLWYSSRLQQREVSKVLLNGLHDADSPLSKLRGPHKEIVGEIIWKQMLVNEWKFYPSPEEDQ